MRTTLYNARYDSRIPAALGLCPDDTTGKLVKWINQAQHVLILKGLYWGTTGKYNICIRNNCITLPPQLACLEKVNVGKVPVKVRDTWFQFIENGPGTMETSINAQRIGNFPTFDEINGVDKNIKWVVDLAEDVGKEALFLGYDENGNWIRTEQDGEMKDGEIIVGAQSAGTVSTKLFSSVTGVQLPEMEGQSWLYEYDAGDAVSRMIGQYQYFERNPSYARYRIPSVRCGCDDSDDSGCQTLVEVIAKHEYIPVVRDTDYLTIGNLVALQWMCVAMKKYEEAENANGIVEAKGFEKMATDILDLELNHYLGSGRDVGMNIVGLSVGANQPIPTFI